MGFLIQWVVYLVAFAAGSAVAYGIATILMKHSASAPDIEPAELGAAESDSDDAESPTIVFEPHRSELESESEIGAKG